jgi:hypothetical protein
MIVWLMCVLRALCNVRAKWAIVAAEVWLAAVVCATCAYVSRPPNSTTSSPAPRC